MNNSLLSRTLSLFGSLSSRKGTAGKDCAYEHPKYSGGDLNDWIKAGIVGYKQWYQPVDFGDGVYAHVTVPPNWDSSPELDEFSGLSRWNYIVKRNIPDVTGMRVLDVGCNVGVFSLELFKLGAREVIGIDRDFDIPQKPDFLPRQNIVSQAKFVRDAIALKGNYSFNVEYKPINFSDYNSYLNLGTFDLIMALNVAYHELDGMEDMLRTLGSMTNTLVLQTALSHGSPIKEWASLPKHVEILTKIGFTSIEIDSPVGYEQPIIVGRK